MYKAIIILLICAPLLQVLIVPWMPGLDSDKAELGCVAYRIVNDGVLNFKGVTPYTGTLRLYLVALSFLIGGASRFTLELPFAIFNPLTIMFVFLALRRLVNGKAGVWTALVISVSPWFVLRDIESGYCTVIAAALYCFAVGTAVSYFFGGIVLGLGCYENQLAVVIVLAALISRLICGKKRPPGIYGMLLAGFGWTIGFSPRLIYKFFSSTPVYVEPFNNLMHVAGDASRFIPYFFGVINGTLVYMRNVGCVTYPVIPFNSVVFIVALLLLMTLWRRRRYRALLTFALLLYLLPFAVIKYTAIRYFLCALFGVALITGLGLYELSIRYRKTAATLLVAYCCVNVFYLCANFFSPFARTGGSCAIFTIGTLMEASHHLVRSDVLYECLDKDVPVIVCPEPFITRNLQFYDIDGGYLKVVTKELRVAYDDFYFIDYAPSKLVRRVDPNKLPMYHVTRECSGLKNFSVYRFQKRIAR